MKIILVSKKIVLYPLCGGRFNAVGKMMLNLRQIEEEKKD